MLEASVYNAVDPVSPFLGAPIDTFCGLFETAEATKVFIQYVYMVKFILGKFFKQGCLTEETFELVRDIVFFKYFTSKIFSI